MDAEDRSHPFNFHKCKKCSFRTRSLRTILSHVNKHTVKSEKYRFCCETADLEGFECQFCYFENDFRLALDRHTVLVHGPNAAFDAEMELKGYICDKCDFETFSVLVYARHVCSEEDDINNVIEECEISKETNCVPDEDTVRLEKNKNKKRLRCKLCPSSSFKSKATLYKHILFLHRKSQSFQCEHCSFKTRYKNHLVNHLESKHRQNKQRFDCYNCSYTTFVKRNLVVHMKDHHKKTIMFSCSHCSYKSPRRCNVKYHIAEVHESTGVQCEECSKTFKNKQSLVTHRSRIHSKEAKFACDKCSFRTVYKANYELHKQVKHQNPSEIRWLRCKQCPFKTTTQTYLKIHIKVKHEERKTYICDICPKTFTSNRSMRGHMKVKHGIGDNVEVFQCEKCSYKTYLKNYLSTHVMLKHVKSEERPNLHCKKCSFKTCFRHDLKRHVDEVHDPKKLGFECDLCEYRCGFIHYLQRHIRSMHR